jgi:hypothetical protein
MTTFSPKLTPENGLHSLTRTLPLSRAIFYATLVVGLLDATDGVVFLGLHGQNPIQVLQYIASSLLGARSYSDGLAAAGLGLVVHFAVSLVVATIYILASQRITVLRTQWVLLGLLFGAGVWVVMNLLLLPLTAVTPRPIATAALANGIIGHALFVGLPSAFFAKKVAATV